MPLRDECGTCKVAMDMSDVAERTDRILAIPGEPVGDSGHKPGAGTYKKGDVIFAAQVGIVNFRAGFVNVIPFTGKYLPRQGDSVIALVQDAGPNSWILDINSPYVAFLHSNETPWKVEYGTAAQFLSPGHVILAKVSHVDETRRVNLSMKEQGLRKLSSGQIMRMSHTKVPRVIGKAGSMISLLKERTGCKIFIGQNGIIWIDGELAGMKLASDAVRLIDAGSHLHGLTDAVRDLLEGKPPCRFGDAGAGNERM